MNKQVKLRNTNLPYKYRPKKKLLDKYLSIKQLIQALIFDKSSLMLKNTLSHSANYWNRSLIRKINTTKDSVIQQKYIQKYSLTISYNLYHNFQEALTWLSIHLSPTAEVHSFLEALVKKSRLYSLSRVSKIVDTLLFRTLTEKISPLELIFIWLFNNVSNHPLPDLCVDNIAKFLTGLQAHSALNT